MDAVSDFADLLASLARGDATDVLHLLSQHSEPVAVAATMATLRTHIISSDANGRPALELLSDAMAAAALDFAIPRKRITKAWQSFVDSGSTKEISRLAAQARELFVDVDGTGEGGELLLFLLMERVLGLPQLVAKMSLKTNTRMHVHGSDGVHARLGSDGVLDLYWGESKLYASVSEAIADCFESIAPFLSADGETRRRDLLLVRDQLNVDQEDLAAHLLQYFDESSALALDVRWNGVCLIGFNYAEYPDSRAISQEHLAKLTRAVGRWTQAVGSRISQHKLEAVTLDVFCIPFPDVDTFRKSVRRRLGVSQ